MALFVINEWIWADLSGENGKDALRQSFTFLEAFVQSEHQLIIIRGMAFDQKAWALCKSQGVLTARIAKTFVLQVRWNSSRARILDADSAAQLPADLAAKVKPDDHYLVRALLSVPGAILITTDAPLRDVVAQHELPSMTREEFLNTYFQIK